MAASAADAGAYAGIALADTNLSHDWLFSSDNERGGSGFSATGGYRFGPSFALEGRFTDYGTVSRDFLVYCLAIIGPCPSGGSVSTHALSVSAVGVLPIGRAELFARGGLARFRTRATISGSFQPGNVISVAHDAGSDTVLGLGVSLPIRRLALRLEYERVAPADDRMGTISAGFVYDFVEH